MLKKIFIFTFTLNLFIIFHLFSETEKTKFYLDLLICGHVNYADGIARLPIIFLDMLKDDFNVGFSKKLGEFSLENIPKNLHYIFEKDIAFNSKVFLYTGILWANNNNFLEGVLPSYDCLKIAYSMLESTKIPKEWTNILNDNFDCVIVPDSFLVDVYKKSGVTIPVFCIPLPLYLEDFLNKPARSDANETFTFGFSAGLWHNNKNWLTLINAFSTIFSDFKNVKLKIHTRIASEAIFEELKKTVEALPCNNIELIHKNLSHNELVAFMESLDCYVLLSKGEGFSITPREALALGVPCILTNNTAQQTICSTGFVQAVESSILEPAFYSCFGDQPVGERFGCDLNDVISAMKEVYFNYSKHKARALKGKVWVEQYLRKNLIKKYSMLISPKKIVLNDCNVITDDCLFTSSKDLYNKYINLMKA